VKRDLNKLFHLYDRTRIKFNFVRVAL